MEFVIDLALIVYSKDSFSDDLGALFVEGIEIHGSNSRSDFRGHGIAHVTNEIFDVEN